MWLLGKAIELVDYIERVSIDRMSRGNLTLEPEKSKGRIQQKRL